MEDPPEISDYSRDEDSEPGEEIPLRVQIVALRLGAPITGGEPQPQVEGQAPGGGDLKWQVADAGPNAAEGASQPTYKGCHPTGEGL